MRKEILLACLCCTLIACQNSNKQATKKLQEARAAYELGNYAEAKQQIDSLKILYPKAFRVRREGNELMLYVERDELAKTVVYLDSLLQERQQLLESLKGNFTFEKEEEYQEVGNYLHPSQVIEKNLHRSFLRFQVDETGLMRMTSTYCGAFFIHHTAVKVSAPDGSFTETPQAGDSYETTDLDEKIEKADYKAGEDGNVMDFIREHATENLRVQYIGERSYTTTLSPTDREAAVAVYELAQLLSSITQLQNERQEADLKREFILRKIAEEK